HDLGGRQLEDEHRALAPVRLGPDASAHAVDQLSTDVEAETGPAHPAGHLGVGAVELLEDLLLVLGRNPEPLVPDVEAEKAVALLDADLDAAAVGGVLDRVLDEVDEHLPDLVRVGG